MRGTWLKLVAMLAGLTLVAVACGGDGEQDLTGPPIKIGHVAAYQSTNIQTPETRDAAQAAVDAINERGGIDGRPLQLVTCNDQFNANEAAACARRLADDTSIVAITGQNSVFGEAVTPVFEAGGLADLGPYPVAGPHYQSPVAFLLNGGTFINFQGTAHRVLRGGFKRPAMIRTDLQQVQVVVQAISAVLGAAKVELIAEQPISQETVDVSASVARAVDANPDAVILALAEPQHSKVVQALYQTAPEVKVITSCAQFTEEILSGLGAATGNLQLVATYPPPHERTLPILKEFNEELDEHAPDGIKRNDLALNSWLAVRVFADVAKDLETIDRASVLSGLRQLEGYDTGGLTPKLDFTKPSSLPGLPNVRTTTTVSFQVVENNQCVSDPGNLGIFDVLTGQTVSAEG